MPHSTVLSGRTRISWQGISLDVPADLNPVRLSGGRTSGQMLLADMDGPRVGLRWSHTGPAHRVDSQKLLDGILVAEVGRLAAAESKAVSLPGRPVALMYSEPSLPGRDMVVAHFPAARRAVALSFPLADAAHKRLAGEVAGTLSVAGSDSAQPWSLYDFAFQTPAGWGLRSHRLTAGDLSYVFEAAGIAVRPWMRVRQLALAAERLTGRVTLETVATQLTKDMARFYGRPREVTAAGGEGALTLELWRKRRVGWMFWLPRVLYVAARIDGAANRVYVVQSSSAAVGAGVLESAMWRGARARTGAGAGAGAGTGTGRAD